ncbi:uncharacterized protein [Musca autumnalis]|uniref:uncharacterized protein n=1 Tax=Musca autumnalis TaxID=221902 RepID=UPI003CF1590D
MLENVSIKTEPVANDYNQENSNNDTHTLRDNTRKLDDFTKMLNDIKKDELDLDNMEEFLPENVEESTIDMIKDEDVEEMDEFLSEGDSTSKEDVEEMDEVLREESASKEDVEEMDEVLREESDVDDMDEVLAEESASKEDVDEMDEVLAEKSDDLTNVITHDEVQHVTQQRQTRAKTKQKDDSKGLETNGGTDANAGDNKDRYKCKLCGISYKENSSLRRHMRKKHPLSKKGKYICENVNEMHEVLAEESASKEDVDEMDDVLEDKSDDRTKVITHDEVQQQRQTRTKTKQKDDSNGLETNVGTDANAGDNKDRYKCKLCRTSYKEDSSLRRHMRKKHPSSIKGKYICDTCNERFATQIGLVVHSLRMHGVAQTPAEHQCELCGSRYMKSKHLLQHIRKKHPMSIDTGYICEICDERFTTQTGLDMHSNRMHVVAQTPTEHKCEVCGSSYTKFSNLQRHMREKHPLSINDKYICEICNQRFSAQKGLEAHCTWLHQGAYSTQTPTKHKCELCGRCYTQAITLRTHMRHKHPLSIDSDYICDICNQRFTTQTGLDMHTDRAHPEAETPTKHKCEICGTCFKEDRHLRTHLSNKHPSSIDSDYICEICNERFATKKGLDEHSDRAHPLAQTSNKYKCEICGCCYGKSYTLRVHIRNKHLSSIDL